MKVGIIGQGNFGTFVKSLLPKNVTVLTYDLNHLNKSDNIDSILKSDILILAIPLNAYDNFFTKNGYKIADSCLVIDVCSVKIIPQRIIDQRLPAHKNILFTHPLFGPLSAKKTTQGHNLIVTRQHGELASKVLGYCKEVLKLNIVMMSAEEHDKSMAHIHALTFFLAKGLAGINSPDIQFQTPSYSMILDLINFNNVHSHDLFTTIEQGNPYAAQVRQDLIQSLRDINNNLTENRAEYSKYF